MVEGLIESKSKMLENQEASADETLTEGLDIGKRETVGEQRQCSVTTQTNCSTHSNSLL